MNFTATRTPSLALLACVAACAPVRAENLGIKAAGISLGGHVSGPMIAPEALAGHVIVLEFWGIHCPPCIASMPQLEELHRQLAPQGLVVIGAHAQGGPVDEVRKTVKDLGVTFTIVENAAVEGGMDFGGIPHCMVFDHTGKCVFRGSPGEAHDIVIAAVQTAPAAILAGRTLVKLAPLAQMLKNEALCGAALKRARPLLDAKDSDTAAEARFVVDRLEARGREMLDEARASETSDPAAAAALAQRCAVAFKGSDIAAEAGKLLQEWRKDKEFQAAVRAGQQLTRLEALRATVKDAPGGLPPQLASQVREIARGIAKGWPGSTAAGRAAAIAAELGVDTAAQP